MSDSERQSRARAGGRAVQLGFGLSVSVALSAGVALARHGELPNRLPEAAPYNTVEARVHPPPYGEYFSGQGNPRSCGTCHEQIYEEWNGSMMSNAWRDPAWRGAFLLIARLTATDGNCDIPDPPDGTPRSALNPFANDDCTSTFDIGEPHTTKGSGSLLDGFCSRCHMPADYIDAVKLRNVTRDPRSGLEHGLIDPDFDPTSARDTAYAFATLNEDRRNTEAGKLGITCTFCHTFAETRHTPFHNYTISGDAYSPARGARPRSRILAPELQELFEPADPGSPTLGYAIGAGSYRLSPHALTQFERFGPLVHQKPPAEIDSYVSGVFSGTVSYQVAELGTATHRANYNVLFERAEMCAACHDVTNPLTIKNQRGKWVGGFPIERTYTEWASSRYADRPGNRHYQPAYKRDCQTCHMQQDYGEPGTAQTLNRDGKAKAARRGKTATSAPEREVLFSHHFVGGNAYSTHLVGANAAPDGSAHPYPELSKYSYSSADPKSPYYNAYWENVSDVGPPTQHARMAWDRLRHALEVEVEAPKQVAPGGQAELVVRVINSGTGHNFPSGFPEGRNAWVAVRAFDVGTGRELEIADSYWKRRSLGIGYLTDHDMVDPNFPGCKWKAPAGAPDPYAWQFRAVASLGDGCPTLDLPYATPLNLVVNEHGLPVTEDGTVIDREHPLGLPQFRDLDGDGEVFDDSYLIDNRLRPMPHPGATLELDRYSVVVPDDVVGPIAVSAGVYYQSMEAVVAKKFMGNLADTDLDGVLEPCVLKGPCDGREPTREPAVVEGSPPVPMRLESRVVAITGRSDRTPPAVNVYPSPNARRVYRDVVPKIMASEPLKGVDARSFRLSGPDGTAVPAAVAQIDDFSWALFPDPVFLDPGKTYYAELDDPVCDLNGNCAARRLRWEFTVAPGPEYEAGDTRAVSAAPPAPLAPVASGGGTGLGSNDPASVSLSRWWLLGGAALGLLVALAGMLYGIGAARFRKGRRRAV